LNESHVLNITGLNFNLISLTAVFDTGGKPSTWFPPGGLVEHMFVTRTQCPYKYARIHAKVHKHVNVHRNQSEGARTHPRTLTNLNSSIGTGFDRLMSLKLAESITQVHIVLHVRV
jgi:hypothetical protein